MRRPEPGPDAGGRSLRRIALLLGLGWLLALAALSLALWQEQRRPLLLMPAMGGLHACLGLELEAPPAGSVCPPGAPDIGAAAQSIEQQLSALGPARSPDGRLELGYTLVIPLLNLFRPDAQAADGWAVDAAAVQGLADTVAQVQRPVVLYLFSTHFSEHAPIEPVLAADADNLAVTPDGPLTVDRFMGARLYPWSIVRTDNGITRKREQAMAAVAEAMCRLPDAARQRIVGLNLLGEVHHLYPDFEAGMGHASRYALTDYSERSRAGFRRWLEQRFGQVAELNRVLGSDFPGFEAIEPPARNILQEPLEHFWQHIDDAAAGRLSVSGWARDGARAADDPSWIRIYLDGVLAGRVPARFVRQDVAQARPDLGTARLGWRHDLRFDRLSAGRHRLDVALEAADGSLQRLGTRHFSVMGRDQAPPADVPWRASLPPMAQPSSELAFWIDTPADERAVFYNPLVPLWHAYREQQVRDYLAHFDQLLQHSCLGELPRRSQQIYPAEGAGWDASRFAADASLRPFGQVQLGINLYGEATGDDSFFDWLARSGQPGYSITEFHPLEALDGPQLGALLERHRRHGARTLSFFLHPPGAAGEVANPLALDPANPANRSDVLYRSVQQLMSATP